MPAVPCDEQSINLADILETSNAEKLVNLIRQKHGRLRPANRIFADLSETNQRRVSFPLVIESNKVPASEVAENRESLKPKLSSSDVENKSRKSSSSPPRRVSNRLKQNSLVGRGVHIKIKRLRESGSIRRSILRDLESTQNSGSFHPMTASTPIYPKFPVVDTSDSEREVANEEVNDVAVANKTSSPMNVTRNSVVSERHTNKKSVPIQVESLSNHISKADANEPSRTVGLRHTQFLNDSMEIESIQTGDEDQRTLVNVEAHQRSVRNVTSEKTMLRKDTTSIGVQATANHTQTAVIQVNASVREHNQSQKTPQKTIQPVDSDAIIATLIKSIRKVEENSRKAASASKIPLRVQSTNNQEYKRPSHICPSPARNSVVVVPIYPPATELRMDKNKSQADLPSMTTTSSKLTAAAASEADKNPPNKSFVGESGKEKSTNDKSHRLPSRSLLINESNNRPLSERKSQHTNEISTVDYPPARPSLEFQITSDEDPADSQSIESPHYSPMQQAGNTSNNSKRQQPQQIARNIRRSKTELEPSNYHSPQVLDLRISGRRSIRPAVPLNNQPEAIRQSNKQQSQQPHSNGSSSSESSNDLKIKEIEDMIDQLNNEAVAETPPQSDHEVSCSNRNSTAAAAEPKASENFDDRLFDCHTVNLVYDYSPHRGKMMMNLLLNKSARSRPVTAGRRGKRVVAENPASRQSQTIHDHIESSLRKSRRRNRSERQSKRKLYSQTSFSETKELSNSGRQSVETADFGLFEPATSRTTITRKKRNSQQTPQNRIPTIQNLLKEWNQNAVATDTDNFTDPTTLSHVEEEEQLFKVPLPPPLVTMRKRQKSARIRPRDVFFNSESSSSSSQTSTNPPPTLEKIQFQRSPKRMTYASDISDRKKKRSNLSTRHDLDIVDDSSTSEETPAVALIVRTEEQRKRSESRIAQLTAENLQSVLESPSGSSVTTYRETLADENPNDYALSKEAFKNLNQNKQAPSDITGIEPIDEMRPTSPKKRGRPKNQPNGKPEKKRKEPSPVSTITANSDGVRRSRRKHRPPGAYWTNTPNLFQPQEINYKDYISPDRKRGKKRKNSKKSKILKTITEIPESQDHRQIADDLFDALKELSQSNDASASANLAPENIEADPDSTAPAKKNQSKKNKKKQIASVATNANEPGTSNTIVNSSEQDGDQQNPATKNYLLSWLKDLVGPKAISSNPELHRIFDFYGVTIVDSENLSFQSCDGVDYAYYHKHLTDTENYGYIRFNPNSKKRRAKAKEFDLRFLNILGNIVLSINGNRVQLKEGGFITIPKGVTYSFSNRSEETALLFFIKTNK